MKQGVLEVVSGTVYLPRKGKERLAPQMSGANGATRSEQEYDNIAPANSLLAVSSEQSLCKQPLRSELIYGCA